MQQAIAEIVNAIPNGKVFDSHFVINLLIREHSEAYLTFVRNGFPSAPAVTANVVHGQIAQEIKKLSNVVTRLTINGQELESRSETIHGEPGDCACWLKIN